MIGFGSNMYDYICQVLCETYASHLDRLYTSDVIGYYQKLEEVKGNGYKVYRNSVGRHKVVKE